MRGKNKANITSDSDNRILTVHLSTFLFLNLLDEEKLLLFQFYFTFKPRKPEKNLNI